MSTNFYARFQDLRGVIQPVSVMMANDWDVWTPLRLHESDLRRYCAVVQLGSLNHLVLFAGEKGLRKFEDKYLDYTTGDHIVSIMDLDTGTLVPFELKAEVSLG